MCRFKVEVNDRHFSNGVRTMEISFLQMLKLKITGYVKIFEVAKKGWSGKLPFYIVKCDKHGLYLDYPHGYKGYFICPECDEEMHTERLERFA